jgi:hypothetical protein
MAPNMMHRLPYFHVPPSALPQIATSLPRYRVASHQPGLPYRSPAAECGVENASKVLRTDTSLGMLDGVPCPLRVHDRAILTGLKSVFRSGFVRLLGFWAFGGYLLSSFFYFQGFVGRFIWFISIFIFSISWFIQSSTPVRLYLIYSVLWFELRWFVVNITPDAGVILGSGKGDILRKEIPRGERPWFWLTSAGYIVRMIYVWFTVMYSDV